MRIDMQAAMAGMMGGRGMMNRGDGGMIGQRHGQDDERYDAEVEMMQKKSWSILLLATIGLSAPSGVVAQQEKKPVFEHAHALAMDSGGQTLFLGAHTGLFRSEDRGRTWQKAAVSTKDAHLDVMDIAADPRESRTIYIGTHEAGVLKSIDGGKTWNDASIGIGGPDVHGLTIDPTTPSKLHAAVRDKGEGIYRTIDQGEKWVRVDDGPQGEIKVLKSVNIPTGMGGIFLYAGTSTGLQRSPDCF